ncbi:hypothetical protein UlMin_044991 [Ulmus minor]
MEVISSNNNILCLLFLFLFLFLQPSHCQQEYLYDANSNCSSNPARSKGYLCYGHLNSCKSYVTFRSQTPYENATSIAYLLGSEASEIASLNNISSPGEKIPTNKSIIVPISCTCSGNIFQHYASYTAMQKTTYYKTARETYQGLTTCQALTGQNYYNAEDIPVGAMLMVPVRCACPTDNQTANGVTSLLTYIISEGDNGTSIGKMFGVKTESILEANMLLQNSTIFAFTPILVPLKRDSCLANPRMFFCSCPDGPNCISDNSKSFPVKLVALLGITVCVGIGFALLFMFLSGHYLYRYVKRRRIRIRKEVFFRQNGGFLLQEKLSSLGINEKAKLFTAEELRRATDNYNHSRFLGKGGYGTVYKGMLPDGTIAAVKRSIEIGRNQIEQFINEVVVLSQINHRNIVKLLGCCLETETPLLVYEFISNGTLSHHIRNKDPKSSLSWENRLSIACDVAGALAYMHSAASIPIFHRDIKSSNILLDDKYKAKIADFGTSRSLPNEKTHLSTAVQGTLGYMDPGYFHTSHFTDKSDVYSYGVTLVELLTGENPFSFAKDEMKNLVATFITLTQENQLFQILDPRVAAEAGEEAIRAIADLATRCLMLDGTKRPTMKEVSMELEGLRKRQATVQIDQELQLTSNEEPVEDSIDFSSEITESTSFS